MLKRRIWSFCRSSSMGLCRRSYNFEDAAASPFATGVADPYKHPSYVSYHASFCRSRSNVASVIKEIRLRKTDLESRLSLSLKVIGNDRDRSATYDFALSSQTDRVSAFVVDRVKICLKSSLITVQKNWLWFLVLCTRMKEVLNFWRRWGLTPEDGRGRS